MANTPTTSTEGYVQVPPDSTGKKMRTAEVIIHDPTGVLPDVTVEQEYMVPVDSTGKEIAPDLSNLRQFTERLFLLGQEHTLTLLILEGRAGNQSKDIKVLDFYDNIGDRQ